MLVSSPHSLAPAAPLFFPFLCFFFPPQASSNTALLRTRVSGDLSAARVAKKIQQGNYEPSMETLMENNTDASSTVFLFFTDARFHLERLV